MWTATPVQKSANSYPFTSALVRLCFTSYIWVIILIWRYQGGQRQILHLESDLKKAVKWATRVGQRWAFSTGNAGALFVRFLNDVGQLDTLNWKAIAANKWRDPDLKEGQQAEFLIERCFPWECISTVGVINAEMAQQVKDTTAGANHRPVVVVHRDWYY